MFSSAAIQFLIKYVIPVAGVLLLLFGVYEHGVTKGHDAGYQEAWSVQQTTINKMIDAQNAENKLNNDRIAGLEQQSETDAQRISALGTQLQTTHSKIVTQYVTANPQSSTTCGFDQPMVQAINALLAPPTN